ncbi:MAG: MBL fold metallo-hydrolase [Clostridia bacterium]|nr:MBL fold metallo-hydrolase [Clostridia bacterium]
MLVTHEHSDHIKGVGILSRKYHLPVYANAPTWAAMERPVGTVPPGCRREFDGSFYLGDFYIEPYAISHDAAAPVGYRVHCGSRSVATATDIGVFRKDTLQALQGADLVLLESNHDVGMLQANPHYNLALKRRILSNKGHMSNEACGAALCSLYDTGVRHAVLGHLSGENNTPDLAYTVVCGILRQCGIEPQRDIRVDMAFRDHVGKVYALE